MTAVLTDTDTVVLDALDFSIPCVGESHKAGENLHTPEQAASFWIICPACGRAAALCASRVAYLSTCPQIHCCGCNRNNPVRPGLFVPIGLDIS